MIVLLFLSFFFEGEGQFLGSKKFVSDFTFLVEKEIHKWKRKSWNFSTCNPKKRIEIETNEKAETSITVKGLTCKWRGRRLPSRSTGIFSSPSVFTVWHVNENVWHTISQALFQSKYSSSISTLMTSAIASDGWVSFIWKATCENNF